MNTNEDRWVALSDAYSYSRIVHGIEGAGKDAPIAFIPSEALKWGSPTRGELKGNPLARRIEKVHLGEYVKAARRALELIKQDEDRRKASNSLEARVAALEAAFDSLLKTTKGFA